MRKLCGQKSCSGTSKFTTRNTLEKGSVLVIQHIKDLAWVIQKPGLDGIKHIGNFDIFSFFQKFLWSRNDKMTCFNISIDYCLYVNIFAGE